MNALEYAELARIAQDQSMDQQRLASQNYPNLYAQQDKNLVEYQLEFDLEKIKRFLRGDVLKFDDYGNRVWATPDDKNQALFNEFGVHEIIRIMSPFLDKNTILSNFREDAIAKRVYDFGIAITDLIHNNYEIYFYIPDEKEAQKILLKRLKEKREQEAFVQQVAKNYGITINELIQQDNFFLKLGVNIKMEISKIQREILRQKIKMFEVIVQQLVHSVESAYNRAYMGGERESLRTARMVTQSESHTQSPMMPKNFGAGQKFSLFKPKTWM